MFPITSNPPFLIPGLALFLFAAALLPNHAQAFWPFSTNADAAAANVAIPSASTPALVASINRNPGAGAPIALATSGGAALVSYNGPAGTMMDVVDSVQSDRISVYVVRADDTLFDISKMFGVSVNTIIWANDLKNARDVHPGDILVILPVSGIERVVVKGDTLKSLAKKYNADAGDIAQFNGLDPAAPLVIGSTLIIPGGEIPVPASNSRSSSSVIREPFLGGGGAVQAGYYSHPLPGAAVTQGLHGWNGIDFGAPRGTPIHAAADGIVIVARGGGAWNGGYGNYVVITHSNGTQTLYSHMKSATVSPGQSVLSGQTIGYVGATGLSTGPHLHFEVRGAANPFRNCPVGRVCTPQ